MPESRRPRRERDEFPTSPLVLLVGWGTFLFFIVGSVLGLAGVHLL